MGVPVSEVGYTSATTGRGDHEVHKGHVMALEKKNICMIKRTVCAAQNVTGCNGFVFRMYIRYTKMRGFM
jgi:hypothetical protein